ncbi:N-acetylglucosamine kinase [Arthrobacter yangruifuii]|uniref:N-acetylglucosamine kinase n=1 Tax=Arthrobacter yangruifuii TaxID=2606616 RepID=A0A5N6MGR1_9MICC|nr:BadF/BadG/BcrA/BcrD ATPase family protein [Arthrobacter yangruifuii]KAD3455991.1 N-acetylglucosamine kinase [Arthrobacter yangruifuii]
MRTFLGVDGGGSKTAFVLISEAGDVLAEAKGPSCYYFEEGIDLVEQVLGHGITAVSEQSGIAASDITQAFFGLPGYGEVSADVPVLNSIPGSLLGTARYSCDNDMICGWSGSLAAADGINIISGTGSMTYGEREGRTHRAGGWGELFGDEGSAYWIAVRGLNAFSRMSDGRLPRGPLYEALKSRVDVRNDLDLVGIVLNQWHGRRTAIADLSKTVVEAAELGDATARQILIDACVELAGIVDATARELRYPPEDIVPVSYSGGMFTAPYLLEIFKSVIGSRSRHYELRAPLLDPGIGAALYAAKVTGSPLSAEALKSLEQLQAQAVV